MAPRGAPRLRPFCRTVGGVKRFVVALVQLGLLGGCGGARDTREVLVPKPPEGRAPLAVVDAGAEPAPPEPAPPAVVEGLRWCDVAHGRVLSCGARADGPTLVEGDDGVFRGCEARAGRVVSCGPPGDGVVPVFDGDIVRACRLVHGRIVGCRGPFDGRAVLPGP